MAGTQAPSSSRARERVREPLAEVPAQAARGNRGGQRAVIAARPAAARAAPAGARTEVHLAIKKRSPRGPSDTDDSRERGGLDKRLALLEIEPFFKVPYVGSF
jgi:hypothetical protein